MAPATISLALVILLPAAGGLLELALARRGDRPAAGLWALAGTALGLAAALWNLPAALAADLMGRTLVLLLTGLGGMAIAVARPHLRADVRAGRARPEWLPVLYGCMALFVAAGCWAALTSDLIHMVIAVEATTLTTVLPVAFYRRATSWEAAFKYLLVNALGLAAALLGIGLLYGAGGAPLPPRTAAIAGVLVIAGFGTKGALVPLHFWLPDAYQESPGGFIALFSGTGTKVALLALARVLPPLAGAAPGLRPLLIALACLTMLLGVALAFAQNDLRRLLAYSSVSQMGYIALGIGVGGAAGYGAAAFHMASHGVLKALLFLCAGWLWQVHGTAAISDLADRRHPAWLGPLFLFGALALGGAPPLPAFWSKFALFLAALDRGYLWAAGVAVLTSLLTLTVLVRTGSRIFLAGRGHHQPAAGGDLPWASTD